MLLLRHPCHQCISEKLAKLVSGRDYPNLFMIELYDKLGQGFNLGGLVRPFDGRGYWTRKMH
jgi:hypothetical protein